MVFCTYTSTAHNLAAALRAAGKSAWAYCSRTMELDERDHNHRAWQAAPCGVICCTGSLGTGTSTANVRLVVCFNFDADPTELLQHLGRPAREDGERGVVAMCMTGQFAVERLALFAPDQREHVACFVRLLKVYFSAGCVRAALLREFGDAPLACAGCDRCCARGTCADPACGALLPVLSVPADGREAACVLLDGLRARSEPLSLSDLLAAPPADARCYACQLYLRSYTAAVWRRRGRGPQRRTRCGRRWRGGARWSCCCWASCLRVRGACCGRCGSRL